MDCCWALIRARIHVFALLLAIAVQTGLLVWSSRIQSPTWDEVGHLAAGISHWKTGRFDLYAVNPPLVRTIAAAPVVLLYAPELDMEMYRTNPTLRSEIFLGRRMVEQHGEKVFDYYFVARLAIVPFAILGTILCFLWARDLFGAPAGAVAAVLWAFTPITLGFGSVITPDLPTIVVTMGAGYLMWKWLEEPSWALATLLGAAMAVCMLTKSYMILLPPIFLTVLIIKWRFPSFNLAPVDKTVSISVAKRIELGQLVFAAVIGLLFTNGFYGFDGSLKKLGGYEFQSQTLTAAVVKPEASVAKNVADCKDCDKAAEVASTPARENRFKHSILGYLPIPLPSTFVQGIDIQLGDFERGRVDPGWKSYLLGSWKQGGWWYFYPIALFVKIPLAVWLLLAVSSVIALWWRPSTNQSVGVLCLWLPALVLFALACSQTSYTRFMRYGLAIYPALIIWASQIGRLNVWSSLDKLTQSTTARIDKGMVYFASAMCFWLIAVAIFNAPNHLSYFNEVAGGPSQGQRVLCDSDIDWGQGLIQLKGWLEKHPEAKTELKLAYFGCFDPAWVGIQYELPQPLFDGDSSIALPEQSMRGPIPGWYVVSKNYLIGHTCPVPDGSGAMHFKYFGKSFCDYLNDFKPIDQIGESMLVYHLDLDQVNESRKKRGIARIEPLGIPAVSESLPLKKHKATVSQR